MLLFRPEFFLVEAKTSFFGLSRNECIRQIVKSLGIFEIIQLSTEKIQIVYEKVRLKVEDTWRHVGFVEDLQIRIVSFKYFLLYIYIGNKSPKSNTKFFMLELSKLSREKSKKAMHV